jgi:hypothetical protein
LSVQKLRPDSFGAPRALATYHRRVRDFDAIADRLSKATGQHDPAILSMLRLWYGRDLRNPDREVSMRSVNLGSADGSVRRRLLSMAVFFSGTVCLMPVVEAQQPAPMTVFEGAGPLLPTAARC